ncbi:hypothetical protein E3O19_00505 [Cryobacterium algoritolerans]|uniref:Mucin-associated surface protein n=1 Tax=Cryobacterium algoritolerans TaxID=1259184 RepID=A0A4R8WXJ0_9MICO|nr:hypothetical protein [Cryobacterium algoritolerans]TFC21254.1 hypothetical protein E3O19_00505 [Cryobacterium algoritolerans]
MNIRSRLASGVAAALLVAATLTACSGPTPELATPTAEKLRSGVLSVSTAAAAGDFGGAQSALTAVQADLLTAAAAGQVSAARSAQIQSAINLVTGDLADAMAASTPTPTPTEKPSPSVDKGDNKDNGDCKKKDDCGH